MDMTSTQVEGRKKMKGEAKAATIEDVNGWRWTGVERVVLRGTSREAAEQQATTCNNHKGLTAAIRRSNERGLRSFGTPWAAQPAHQHATQPARG